MKPENKYLESIEDLKIYMLSLSLSDEQETHIINLAQRMVNAGTNVVLQILKNRDGDKNKFIDVLIENNNLKNN